MQNHEVLAAMVDSIRTAPYTACTGAGEPLRSTSKIIGGHKVTAKIIGWDERIVFELPYQTGTKSLTLGEAVEVLAA